MPAARVRTPGEFLREVDGGPQLSLPGLRFEQDGRQVRTPGLGFRYLGDSEAPRAGAESLGQSNAALAAEPSHHAHKEPHVQSTRPRKEP